MARDSIRCHKICQLVKSCEIGKKRARDTYWDRVLIFCYPQIRSCTKGTIAWFLARDIYTIWRLKLQWLFLINDIKYNHKK